VTDDRVLCEHSINEIGFLPGRWRPNAMHTAARLRLIRGDLGLSEQELALEIGIPPSLYARLEGGAEPPSLDVLQALQVRFDVHPFRVLFGYDRDTIAFLEEAAR
jgi:transcriptional regulator with XRE-family HTH domain